MECPILFIRFKRFAMHLLQQEGKAVLSGRSAHVAFVLIVSLLLWATGMPALVNRADAAALTSVKDTLSDSDLGVLATHVIQFTNATSTIAGQTIKIQLDPVGSAFTQVFSSATTTDITATGMTIVNTCGGGTDEVTVTGNYNGGTDENLTLTVCVGDSLTAGAKTITVGAVTRLWTNPAGAGSYRILIGGTQDNSGETRVVTLDDVVMMAAVDTIFTFTVTGIATSSTVNGEVTTGSTTPTIMNFGTLAPGTPAIMAQRLNVLSNAAGGFTVTVQANQNLLSSTGADIDTFKDGASTAVPTAWTAPVNTLGSEATYGHFGVTSEDSSLSAGDEFGTSLFAGNLVATPREVFYHTGSADNITNNIGSTSVAYKVQVASLQEAGNDYTATLTYVATPTF